jgi:uncharacterized membrane protein YhiD involved in acid resistance
MSFNDIFKTSFLEKVQSFSLLDTVIALALSFALGLFIFLIYKKTFAGVMYSPNFGVALIGLSMVATTVILAVTSNVVLSLGMVGALSIVRFRTAIKEPLDIVFLFWAIAIGIVLGAGIIPLAVIGSVVIGVVLLIFANRHTHDSPYILIISCHDDTAERSALEKVTASVRKYIVKSKTVTSGGIELTLEIRLRDMTTEFVNEISASGGVTSATLVSYNGDYMS